MRSYMRTFGVLVVLSGLLTFGGGCTKAGDLSPVALGPKLPTPLPTPVPTIPSPTNLYTPPQADNILCSNLYNQYQSQSGNIFFSPFSIITAMAMAQEGAVGPTAIQMQTVLNLNSDSATRQQGFQRMISAINAPGKSYTLDTSDNVWPQANYPILPLFLNTLETYYTAGVTAVDYIGNPTGALATINGAVSIQTEGYIPSLLAPSAINNNTRLILTNAIYFKADWQSQFQTFGTFPQNFNLTSTSTETVSMMHQTLSGVIGTFNGAASVFALNYKNNEASMYIFLPPPGGMAALEGAMTGSNINAWLAANSAAMTSLSPSLTQVALALPKFTFSTNYDLTSTLSAMGMPLAFTPGSADFSGINGQKNLYISKVVHKAYVEVTETGTIAAAATGVVGGDYSVSYTPAPVPFIVDHPFIFLIVENTTNTVLFVGRVNDPLLKS